MGFDYRLTKWGAVFVAVLFVVVVVAMGMVIPGIFQAEEKRTETVTKIRTTVAVKVDISSNLTKIDQIFVDYKTVEVSNTSLSFGADEVNAKYRLVLYISLNNTIHKDFLPFQVYLADNGTLSQEFVFDAVNLDEGSYLAEVSVQYLDDANAFWVYQDKVNLTLNVTAS